ncbi:MAG: hypothetical protein ED557_06520 [Balneola sp.]|nr:MAG: hypothetical protein ED557_06520 [Balneola sp.]
MDNLGDEIAFGNDTVRVRELKFTSTAFIITNEDSAELVNSEDFDIFLYAYVDIGDTDVIVLSTDLGFELNGFVDYELDIGPISTRDPFFDNDFYGDDNITYSLVIEGTVNGSDFFLRTTPSFTKRFAMDGPVNISDSEETLFVRTTIDIQALFQNGDGEFLNPNLANNISEINGNFRNLLEGEMFAGSIVNVN